MLPPRRPSRTVMSAIAGKPGIPLASPTRLSRPKGTLALPAPDSSKTRSSQNPLLSTSKIAGRRGGRSSDISGQGCGCRKLWRERRDVDGGSEYRRPRSGRKRLACAQSVIGWDGRVPQKDISCQALCVFRCRHEMPGCVVNSSFPLPRDLAAGPWAGSRQ